MVDPILIGGLVEGARMALQLYMTLAAQAGLSEAEIDKMLAEERGKFYSNRPDLLPKPPAEE